MTQSFCLIWQNNVTLFERQYVDLLYRPLGHLIFLYNHKPILLSYIFYANRVVFALLLSRRVLFLHGELRFICAPWSATNDDRRPQTPESKTILAPLHYV